MCLKQNNYIIRNIKAIIPVILFLIVCSGCLIKSVHPFYFDKDVVYKPELTGSWIDQDSNRWELEQYTYSKGFLSEKIKDDSYQLSITEDKNQKSVFNVHLFMLDGYYFMDFYPLKENDDMFSYHVIGTHTIAKVVFEVNNKFVLKWYNETWLNWLISNKKLRIKHEILPDEIKTEGYQSTLLTAPTRKLQKFLKKYSEDDRAFMEDVEDQDNNNEVFVFELTKMNAEN